MGTLNNVYIEVDNITHTVNLRNVSKFLKNKSSPTDLAQNINGSDEAIGASIFIVDSGYNVLHATNRFYLTGFSFTLKERAQLLDSFTAPIVTFMDESVKVYNFTGVGADMSSGDGSAKNFNHSSLIELYNSNLRGTQLVRNGHIAVLRIGNHTVYGYPLNLTTGYSSSADKTASFSLAMAVAKHTLDVPGIVSNKALKKLTSVVLWENQITFNRALTAFAGMFTPYNTVASIPKTVQAAKATVLNAYMKLVEYEYTTKEKYDDLEECIEKTITIDKNIATIDTNFTECEIVEYDKAIDDLKDFTEKLLTFKMDVS